MTKLPKRPRDTNQLGKLVTDILTGQVEDRERTPEERGGAPTAEKPKAGLWRSRRTRRL
jgi:hypothetical protein